MDIINKGTFLPRPAFDIILSFLVAPKIDKSKGKSNIQKVHDNVHISYVCQWIIYRTTLRVCGYCSEPHSWVWNNSIHMDFKVYKIEAGICLHGEEFPICGHGGMISSHSCNKCDCGQCEFESCIDCADDYYGCECEDHNFHDCVQG